MSAMNVAGVLRVLDCLMVAVLVAGCGPVHRAHPGTVPYAGPVLAADPFRGSPAETYADGAAGIVLPTVSGPVAGFSAAQARQRLGLVRQALVAMDMDPRVWAGAEPGDLLALLDRDQSAAVRRAFATPTAALDPGRYATRFDPGGSQVYGSIVKVRGIGTLQALGSRGPLRVHVDCLFVYAVHSVGEGPVRFTRVVLRRSVDFDFYQEAPGRLVLSDAGWSAAGVQCGWTDGFLHPAFGGMSLVSPAPTFDPYDLTGRPDTGPVGCASAARV